MKKLFTTIILLGLVFGISLGLEAVSKKSRQAYVTKWESLLTPEIKECILNEKICLGMGIDDVKASWGKPDSISKSVGKWGRHEQWVYILSSYSYKRKYLYFEQGKLTSWSD